MATIGLRAPSHSVVLIVTMVRCPLLQTIDAGGGSDYLPLHALPDFVGGGCSALMLD